MPHYIATYDLRDEEPSPYETFKRCAAALGWFETVFDDRGRLARLPNTTLSGTFLDIRTADAVLHRALANASALLGYSIEMPRYFITMSGEIMGASDDIFGPKRPTGLLSTLNATSGRSVFG